MTRRSLATLFALAALLGPVRAEQPETRFRGTVEMADGERLTIRRDGGSTLAMRMNSKTRIFAATAGEIRQIKPESYVGILSRSGTEPSRAEGVTLFSPSERGFEAGRQPWDGPPGTTFTGGWIADLGRADPRRVTLAYDRGQASFEIPRGTPVTQVAPGEKALLVPGAPVTAITHARGDGALEAVAVFVGRLGTVPTL